MAVSIREVIATCLGRTGTLSLKTDLFGMHGTSIPHDRSVLAQLDLIQHKPFVRVAMVTVLPALGRPYRFIQRDLDYANEVFQRYCGAWVYCAASVAAVTDILGSNGIIDQDDCTMGGGFLGFGGHSVSDEEDALFDLGRHLGADVVCYYIRGTTAINVGGCAAHPDGRPGFWVTFDPDQCYMFAHELGHILGLAHVDDSANLMFGGAFTSFPPKLDELQCWRMFGEGLFSRPYVECCG